MLVRGHALTLCLALASAGCGTILGLGDFEDVEDAAASSSGPGSGGGPGAGGSGGSGGATGGSGGGPPELVCEQSEQFDIFSAGEITGKLDNERLFVVADSSEMRAHVAVVNEDSRQVLARTLRTNKEVSPIARYPDQANQLNDVRIMDGYLDGPTVKYPGAFNGESGEVHFQVEPDVQMPGLQVAYPAPAVCGANELDVHKGPTGVRFAASCSDQGANADRLYGGTPNGGGPDYVISGQPNDDTLSIRGYTHIAGTDVVVHTGDIEIGTPTVYRFGKGLAQLSTTYALEPDPGLVTFPLGILPSEADDAVLMFTVSAIAEATADIRLRSGLVPLGDLAKLSTSPTTYLQNLIALDSLAELGFFRAPQVVGDHVIAAGTANLDRIAAPTIRLYVWGADARPIISGQVLKTASGGVAFGASVAAPTSPFASLVAWIEQDGAVFTVRGVFVQCEAP